MPFCWPCCFCCCCWSLWQIQANKEFMQARQNNLLDCWLKEKKSILNSSKTKNEKDRNIGCDESPIPHSNIYFTLFFLLSLFLLHFVLVFILYVFSFVVAHFDYHKSPSFSLVAITLLQCPFYLYHLKLCLSHRHCRYDTCFCLSYYYYCSDSLSCALFIKWFALFPTYTTMMIWIVKNA